MDKVIYRDPQVALTALLAAAVEGPREGEWVSHVSFGRFDDSVNRGESYYWSLSVTRNYGNTRSGGPEQVVGDRIRRCLEAHADWVKRQAAKDAPSDPTEGGKYDSLGSSGSDQG